MLRLGLRRGCLSRLGRGRELGTLRHQTRPHQSNAAHTNTQNMCLAIYQRGGNLATNLWGKWLFPHLCWLPAGPGWGLADRMRSVWLSPSSESDPISRSWRPRLSLRGHKNLPQNATSRRIIFYVSQMLYPSVPSPDSDQGDFLSSQIISRLCFLCAVSSK